MDVRYAVSKKEYSRMNTEELRENFLIQNIFEADKINLTYSHIDRIIAGGACPVKKELPLLAGEELGAEYFCERRELGVINIGGAGTVTVDGKVYKMDHFDGLYIGRGTKEIVFKGRSLRFPSASDTFPLRRRTALLFSCLFPSGSPPGYSISLNVRLVYQAVI